MSNKSSENLSFPDKGNSYTTMLGFLRRVQKPNGTWVLKVVWSRVFLAILLLIPILWTMMACAIYVGFKYLRDYDEMSFIESFAVPFDLQAHRQKVGEYNIRKAKEFIKAKNWREAFMNLNMGVMRSPKNVEGRQMLSEFFVALWGRPDLAIKNLEQGLLYAKNNTNYIRFYTRILLDQNEDKKLITVAEKLLSDGDLTNKDVEAYLAMAISSVYAMHGNYAKSKEFLVKYKLDKTLPGILRLSKNEWEQGHQDEAIKIISDNFDSVPNKEPIYALLVNYYNSIGDYEKARQYSVLRSAENPFSIDQQLNHLRILKKDGESVKEKANAIFESYKNDNHNLIYIANFAADTGDIDLMRRIYDTALQNNYPIAPYCLLLLETMITIGDYKSAVAFSEEIIKEKPSWIKKHEDVFACLRAICYYATGNLNLADILVEDVLKRSNASPKVLIATARRLDALKDTKYSYKLLEQAVDRFPRHQLALTRLIQIEMKMGNSTNLDKHIFRLLQMRRPPRQLVEKAREDMASDRFIFVSNRDKLMNEIDILLNNHENQNMLSNEAPESRITDDATPEELGF